MAIPNRQTREQIAGCLRIAANGLLHNAQAIMDVDGLGAESPHSEEEKARVRQDWYDRQTVTIGENLAYVQEAQRIIAEHGGQVGRGTVNFDAGV